MKIDLARARAHWHARAGLAAAFPGAADDVIARTGWLRTLGGVDVYLSARARVPGLARTDLDALVDASRVRVVPAARGGLYLVPAAHVPLALHVASAAWRKTTAKELTKAGAGWKEIEALGAEIVKVLAAGSTTTDRLRKALPDGAVPIALRHLELEQRIERTLDGGRVDTERYLWRLARGKPGRVPDDPHAALARIFAGFAGPFPLADFAGWAGLSQRDARAAIARAGLAPLEVDGYAEEAWIVPEDLAELARAAEPSAAVSLLGFEDHYLAKLTEATNLASRAVIVGGQLAGIWEMDPDAGQVLWATFAPAPRAARAEIDRLATETARFLGEVGHARRAALDTQDEVRKRASEVARVAGGEGLTAKAPRRAKKKKPDVHRDRPAAKRARPAARRRGQSR